jgi:hypothetical protein
MRDFLHSIGRYVPADNLRHMFPVAHYQLGETINIPLKNSLNNLQIFRHRLLHSDEDKSPGAACRQASYRKGLETHE